MKTLPEFRPGVKAGQRWRHCKGTVYEIVGLADHTETEDILVLYRVPAHRHEHARIWARPLGMFLDRHDSGAWRFELVSEAPVETPEPRPDPLLGAITSMLRDEPPDGTASEAR